MTDPDTPRRCPNCDTPVVDRYCAHCGQDNRFGRLTVSNLAGSAFQEIADLELPMLHTVIMLMRSPGRVCRDYLDGRRARYTNPVKLAVICLALVMISFAVFDIHPGRAMRDVLEQPAPLRLPPSQGEGVRSGQAALAADTYADAALDTDADPDAAPDADPDPDSAPDSAPDAAPAPDSAPDAASDTDTAPDADPDTDAASDPDADPDPASDPAPDAALDTASDPDPAPDTTSAPAPAPDPGAARRARLQELVDRLPDVINGMLKPLTLAIIPMIALLFYVLIGIRRVTYAEALSVLLFMHSGAYLITTLLSPTRVLNLWWGVFVTTGIDLAYFTWAIRGCFGFSLIGTVLRSVLLIVGQLLISGFAGAVCGTVWLLWMLFVAS